MAAADWIFWKVTDAATGDLEWLGVTRHGARSAIDREKVWTLIPRSRVFVANWYVTEDYMRSPSTRWAFENIELSEARDLLTDLPDPSADDVARITRPGRILTPDQVNRFEALKVLGKTANSTLGLRR